MRTFDLNYVNKTRHQKSDNIQKYQTYTVQNKKTLCVVKKGIIYQLKNKGKLCRGHIILSLEFMSVSKPFIKKSLN